MDKTTLGLIAALGVAAATPASANVPANAVHAITHPTSVAELLEPISNPVATLGALQEQPRPEQVELADMSIGPDGVTMHHHHHHHYYRRRHHHHHHHLLFQN
jgi:hypothetical protein